MSSLLPPTTISTPTTAPSSGINVSQLRPNVYWVPAQIQNATLTNHPGASAPADTPANPSEFQTLAQLWAASFGQPASSAGTATGDGPYVIASQGSASAASTGTPNTTAIVILAALAIGGYFLYKRMKS